MIASFQKANLAYKSVGLETQATKNDQYQLVVMMFDAILESLTKAKGAIASNNVAEKVAQITKAMKIVQEGLRTSLDLENGGELAANLAALYDYCMVRMTQANATNDAEALTEVSNLITQISEAWRELRESHQPSLAANEPLSTPVRTDPEPRASGQLRRAYGV